MRVGGPADLFATVHNVYELRALIRFARSRDLPLTLLGRGSNVVIADAGHPRPRRPEPGRGHAGSRATDVHRRGGRRRWPARRPRRRRRACPGSSSGWRSRARSAAPSGRMPAPTARRRGGPRIGRRPARRRHGGASAVAELGLGYRDSRFKTSRRGGAPADRPRRDVPPRAGDGRRDRGAARRDPPLAPGAPAARASRRPAASSAIRPTARRPASSSRRRPEGPGIGGATVSREARQLHRQRPEGHGGRRPAPRRRRPREVERDGGIDLVPEIVFLGDWLGRAAMPP